MPRESMLARFQGDQGRRLLVEALESQPAMIGDAKLAEEFANIGTICELFPGDILIRQDHADNDIFFILTGVFRVLVNGREVAIRRAGQHVGEMAIVDPSSRRTASVIASEQSIVVKVAERHFSDLADRNPRVWRSLARELSHRLDERKKFHREPNIKAVLFIGSSTEQLPIAEALKHAVPNELATVILWSQGVFGASNFPIDDLNAQIRAADFAVLVAGADDQVISRGSTSDTPRDNVVFELGLFMGALSRARTFIMVPKDVKLKIPTDLLGLTCLQFDSHAGTPSAAVGHVTGELLEIIARMGPR